MSTDGNDGSALIRWVEGQDAEAFKELVDRHSGMVYATCRRILKDPGEAEDVAQECFENLARYQGQPPEYLGPWLHRVATNLACKRIRSAVRRKNREEAYASERPGAAEPRWDDVYRYVDEAIDELPERLRAPLVAHFIEGHTHQHIAEELGISRQSVTDRVGLGVRQVRRSLARRNITISIPLLAGFLGSQVVEAAPARLTATLGKLALSGVRRGLSASGVPAVPIAPMVGGILVMKKVFVGSALVLVLLIVAGIAGYFYTMRQLFGPPELPPIALEKGVYEPIEVLAEAASPAAPEPALAQTPEAAPADPDAPYVNRSAFLRGRVVREDGSPVPDAAVQLERGKVNWLIPAELLTPLNLETRSDSDGYFQFDAIPVLRGAAGGGQYEYTFHLRARAQALAAYRNVDVSPRSADQFVKLILQEGGVLAGVVHDDQGVPLAGAAVFPSIVGTHTTNRGDTERLGGLDPMPVHTDDLGRFSLSNVVEGAYRLEVRAQGFGRFMSDTFRVGNRNIDITLPRGGSISGTVAREKTGELVAGQLLLLNPLFSVNNQKGLSPGQFGTSGGDGSYYFSGLVFGPYEVLAIDENSPTLQRQEQARAAVILAEGENVTDLKVLLRDGAAVEGRVLEADSRKPIPFALVWIVSDPRTDYSIGRTVTDEKGQFQFNGLGAGNWLLQTLNDRQRYQVTLREGQVLRNTDLLVPCLAPITGRVVDSEGATLEGATVSALGSYVMNHISPHFTTVTAETDASGNFSLSGLTEPEDVTLQARHGSGVSPRLGPIRWGKGGKRNITLTVQKMGAIAGTLVDRDGQPVSDAELKAFPRSDSSLLNTLDQGNVRSTHSGRDYQGEAQAVTGADGRFDFGRLLADTYDIEVDDRRTKSQHKVTLAAGEMKTDLTITIDRGPMGSLEGTVTMGSPLPGLMVSTRYETDLTDENGAYRFDGLPAGELHVHVVHHRVSDGHEAELEIYETVQIDADRTARLDLAFPTSGGAVEGMALLNGAPARGATVEGPDVTATVGDDGRYRIEGLPEGTAALRLQLTPFDQGELEGSRKEVEVSIGDVSTVDFEVFAGALHGQIEGLAEGERCQVVIVPGEIDAGAMGLEELAALIEQSEQTLRVPGDGPFYLTNAPAGTCTVIAVAHEEGGSLDATSLAGARIVHEVVQVTDGQMPEIDFRFP